MVDSNLIPLGLHASYLVNRMKDYGILMSTDGPENNVLKIKPPLVFSIDNAKEVLFYLKKIILLTDLKLKVKHLLKKI